MGRTEKSMTRSRAFRPTLNNCIELRLQVDYRIFSTPEKDTQTIPCFGSIFAKPVVSTGAEGKNGIRNRNTDIRMSFVLRLPSHPAGLYENEC